MEYKIANADVKICDPADGVIGEVELKDGAGKSVFYSLAEIEGFPSFFRTEESTIEKQAGGSEDEAFFDILEECRCTDYVDYEDILKDGAFMANPVYRYLIYLVRCSMVEADDFMAETRGKMLSGISIPASDIEEEYL